MMLAIGTAWAQKDKELVFKPLIDGVEYAVTKVQNLKGTETGAGGAYNLVAEKGYSFKKVWFEIKNTSDENKELDFTKFSLIDSKNRRYEAKMAIQRMSVSVGVHLEHTLKAGKTKTFTVEFWPPVSNSEKNLKLEINGELTDIEYVK